MFFTNFSQADGIPVEKISLDAVMGAWCSAPSLANTFRPLSHPDRNRVDFKIAFGLACHCATE